jgi:hypothetical protein
MLVLNGSREGGLMRTLLVALCVTGICAGACWARDASTPPALGDTPGGNSMQVRVSAHEGIVQLSGTVPRDGDCDAAEHIARRVAGVRDVTNKIVVSADPAGPGASRIPERPRP